MKFRRIVIQLLTARPNSFTGCPLRHDFMAANAWREIGEIYSNAATLRSQKNQLQAQLHPNLAPVLESQYREIIMSEARRVHAIIQADSWAGGGYEE